MTPPPLWTGREPLPVGEVRLLEASAGTGKTWQIAHLVARLVAECGVPIERILVLTFTKPATAELRDRVRRRLVEARDRMAGPPPDAAADPLLAHLYHAAERPLYATRLAVAVAAFDLAPISTIHGFAQQMLAQLAFASGQEARLELLADLGPVLDEWVADTLARAYTAAPDTRTLAVVEDLGFTPAALRALTQRMSGPVAPALDPDEPEGAVDVVAAATAWLAEVDDLRTWLAGDAGLAAVTALRDEMQRPAKTEAARRKVPARRFGRTLDPKVGSAWYEKLQAWLANGACWLDGPADGEPWFAAFGLAKATAAWEGSDPLATFAGFPLFARIDRLLRPQAARWPRARVAFARGARVHVEAELQRRGLLTYDAMLARLAEKVATQGPEGDLAQAIRARFDAALVDEFQDTDSAQWQVLRAVFRHPDRRLLLIGDPKQAIYAFRGADVFVYLRAAGAEADAGVAAPVCATMTTNWRSDAAYLAAMNALWQAGSHPFDHPGFDYIDVRPAQALPPSRIHGTWPGTAAGRRPFEVRWFDGTTLGADEALVTQKELGVRMAARLCAREVVALLAHGRLDEARVDTRAAGGGGAQLRPVRPHDIAVLVRTNAQASRIREQLSRCGVPAVAAAKESVFGSVSATWLAAWLEAVAAPGHERAARALAVTPLFGWSLAELADALRASEDLSAGPPVASVGRDWTAWRAAIARWSAHWPRLGFVGVLQRAFDEWGVLERVLATATGERAATDLRHLVELCHAEDRRTRPGPAGLARWLAAQADAARTDRDETRSQRLETDAQAVQIVTVHRSKGLEYPIVLLPFGWESPTDEKDKGHPVAWHDAAGTARLDLRPRGAPGRAASLAAAQQEARQEERRLLYVALTRAAHHCVVWLGPIGSTATAPEEQALAWLLLRDRTPRPDADALPIPAFALGTGAKAPETLERIRGQNVASQAEWRVRLDQLAADAAGTIGFSREAPLVSGVAPGAVPASFAPDATAPVHGATTADLRAAEWPDGRTLASAWQVASYTSLVHGKTHEADEPRRPDLADATSDRLAAPVTDEVMDAEPGRPLALAWQEPVPLAGLVGGADVGTWVHAVLEQLDFRTGRARDGRPAAVLAAELGALHGVRDATQHALLAQHLPALLATPLDGAATGLPPGWALRDLAPADRVDELGFDLRLASGTAWRIGERTVDPAAVGAALALRRGARGPAGAASRDSAANWDGAGGWGGAGGWVGDPWLQQVLAGADLFPGISGILTGFIDLVFRVGGRYYLADYKTNRIRSRGGQGANVAAPDAMLGGHYAQPWLAWEMGRHGYHLQALLYTVALRRFLRQRLPGFDAGRDLGGHLYLFVRGMTGAAAPRDAGLCLGVYHDRWPLDVVTALDVALGGDA